MNKVERKRLEKQKQEDQTLLLRCLINEWVRWEAWDSLRGELCFLGMRYCLSADGDGIPLLNSLVRSKLLKLVDAGEIVP